MLGRSNGLKLILLVLVTGGFAARGDAGDISAMIFFSFWDLLAFKSNSEILTVALSLLVIILAGFCIYLCKRDMKREFYIASYDTSLEIFDSIGEGVVLTDSEGVITHCNIYATSHLNCYADDIKNSRISFEKQVRIFSNGGSVPVVSPLREAFKSREVVKSEKYDNVLLTPGNKEINITYLAVPVINNEGEIVGGAFVFRDLTPEINIKAQLQHSQRLESIGRLAGSVAHDFNNMIGAISGTTEVMMMQVADDDGMTRYLRRILATTLKAGELTNRLLNFTRKDSVQGASGVFILESVVKDALDIIERSIDPKVTIEARLDDSNCMIFGSSSLVENMVINLCLNASDAMPGGGRLEVSIRVEKVDSRWCEKNRRRYNPGEYAVLSVIDNGVGIAREHFKDIFEPFYTTKGVGKGSGFGLAAVQNTVSEHAGYINVESELGEGSKFEIFLPLATTEEVEAQEESAGAGECVECKSGVGTILLADDEEFMRDAGRMMLEYLGYEVILAENGQQAVEMYKRHRKCITLVILDMVMPHMSGRDAFREIIAMNSEAKIIIASGYSREARINKLFDAGLKAFVKKPYRQAEIAQLLQEVINA